MERKKKETLDKIFKAMQDYRDERNEITNNIYNNIKDKAENGDKDAQTIINFGSEKEIKDMIYKDVVK